MEKLVKRTSFVTSRQLEFFSEKELTMQIGHPVPLWPSAILKELIDNSLDACETAAIAPRLLVVVENDRLSVKDNGSGLPPETLRRSLDYSVRVSDKAYYVSPTRGRLGNALKCVWAAPFVVDGQRGHVEVAAQGTLHRIDVTMDAIDQEPRLAVTEKRSLVKNGTFIRLHWPEVARCLAGEQSDDFYNARRLLTAYATFNPHAAFALATDALSLKLAATDRMWQKWRSNWPTSAHWYSSETFRALIAAYIAMERRGGSARTVREFVAEFDGLTGSLKQKSVLQMAGLSKAALHDLAAKGSVKVRDADRLLSVMKHETVAGREDREAS
jgi:DNA topoisomerase VI subunit B